MYVQRLEEQLKEEREARILLEKEVEEMKLVNAEIANKLGITMNLSN